MAYVLAAVALIGALTGLAAVLRDPPSAPSEASSAVAPDAPAEKLEADAAAHPLR